MIMIIDGDDSLILMTPGGARSSGASALNGPSNEMVF